MINVSASSHIYSNQLVNIKKSRDSPAVSWVSSIFFATQYQYLFCFFKIVTIVPVHCSASHRYVIDFLAKKSMDMLYIDDSTFLNNKTESLIEN